MKCAIVIILITSRKKASTVLIFYCHPSLFCAFLVMKKTFVFKLGQCVFPVELW